VKPVHVGVVAMITCRSGEKSIESSIPSACMRRSVPRCVNFFELLAEQFIGLRAARSRLAVELRRLRGNRRRIALVRKIMCRRASCARHLSPDGI
jgi:hypothetical protein